MKILNSYKTQIFIDHDASEMDGGTSRKEGFVSCYIWATLDREGLGRRTGSGR